MKAKSVSNARTIDPSAAGCPSCGRGKPGRQGTHRAVGLPSPRTIAIDCYCRFCGDEWTEVYEYKGIAGGVRSWDADTKTWARREPKGEEQS